MELYQLEYFRTLCRYKSYTKTAQKYDVTQPAVTAAIKKLEAELGGFLIDRSLRDFGLTPTLKDSEVYDIADKRITQHNL